MNFETSLLPVLGGYWILTNLVPTRTEALRQSGYHVAFRSAVAGLLLLVPAYLLVLVFEGVSSWPEGRGLPDTFKVDFELVAMMSALLGFLGPYALNGFFDKGKAEDRVAGKYGDLVELLIAEAIRRSLLIEVSLRTGKSYIGFAIGNTISRWPESDLALLPISSGYRHKDTQELVITTNYAPVMSEHIKDVLESPEFPAVDFRDFRVVIPRSEIVSARLFNPGLHQKFQSIDNRSSPAGAETPGPQPGSVQGSG